MNCSKKFKLISKAVNLAAAGIAIGMKAILSIEKPVVFKPGWLNTITGNELIERMEKETGIQ